MLRICPSAVPLANKNGTAKSIVKNAAVRRAVFVLVSAMSVLQNGLKRRSMKSMLPHGAPHCNNESAARLVPFLKGSGFLDSPFGRAAGVSLDSPLKRGAGGVSALKRAAGQVSAGLAVFG